jgi:AmmeMemoRadiSam system protein B
MKLQVDEDEHSIELHLPFIARAVQATGRNIPIVPILVGALSPAMESLYGRALSTYAEDSSSFFVISSDFCHWGERFEYQPFPARSLEMKQSGEKTEDIFDFIRQLDEEGMALIEDQDVSGFEGYLQRTGNTICGRHPIAVYMHALQAASTKLEIKFVRYKQSDKVTDTSGSSVSYASAVFSEA